MKAVIIQPNKKIYKIGKNITRELGFCKLPYEDWNKEN